MTRLPFDPSLMAGNRADGGAEPAPDRPLSVSRLAEVIDRAVRGGVPAPILVRGEVTGFTDRTHWYFSLKDEHAVVSCVMFASAARNAAVRPGDGVAVVVRGRVEFYPRQGRTQLYVDRLEPAGAGDLDARFRALCAELRGAGYFDADRKRALPTFPRRLAVVTSRSSAALQDVLDTVRRRCPAVSLLLAETLVQGDGAAARIAARLDECSSRAGELGIEAIILTRGGGSPEDLWAFNERIVADALLRCAVPVVAAIGHESDTTVAELVADQRAATPTQAAMLATPDRSALLEQLDGLRRRLAAAVAGGLRRDAARLGVAARGPVFSAPSRALAEGRSDAARAARSLRSSVALALSRAGGRVDRAAAALSASRPEAALAVRAARADRANDRLRRAAAGALARADPAPEADALLNAMHDALRRARRRLNAAARELEIVGPANVLHRGYSVTTDRAGRVIRAASEVAEGDEIDTTLAEGRVRSVVAGPGGRRPAAPDRPGAGRHDLPPRESDEPAPRRRRPARPPRTPRHDPGQLGLF